MSFEQGVAAEEQVRQLITRYDVALAGGVTIGYPEREGEKPVDVFPAPTQPRAEAPDPQWSADQEQGMRAAAAEFGFGRTTDRTIGELGLTGAHVVYEGGKPWKIEAEAAMVGADDYAQPASYTFAASPNRKIGEDEKTYIADKFGAHPETEYQVAQMVAEKTAGFVAHAQSKILPFSYDVTNKFAPGEQASGQLVEIGTIGEAPVRLLRIDHEDYIADDGSNKYRNQPRTGDVVKLIADTQPEDSAPIAFVTSATYQASHELAAVQSGLAMNRPVGVPTYGTARLAEVKGESVPAPAPINQLPGELHVAAQNVEKLRGLTT